MGYFSGAPIPEPSVGLGAALTRDIDLVSLGLARPLAEKLAQAVGSKSCGCDERAACLDALVPDVRKMTPIDWAVVAPRALMCLLSPNRRRELA